MNKNENKSRGMTLVGVLVGITILGVALAAQIRLLGNTIRRESELRSIIIATNLAREGIEIAFSWRVTSGWNYLKEIKNHDYCPDIVGGMLPAPCDSNKALYYLGYPNESRFKAYLYGSRPADYGYDTPAFWRTVRIENCPDSASDNECLELVSKAGWDKNDNSKNIQLTKKIYNWYVP